MIKGYPEELKHGFMCNHCGNDDLSPCRLTAYQCKSCMGVQFGPPVVCPSYLAREFAQLVMDSVFDPDVRRAAQALLGALGR